MVDKPLIRPYFWGRRLGGVGGPALIILYPLDYFLFFGDVLRIRFDGISPFFTHHHLVGICFVSFSNHLTLE